MFPRLPVVLGLASLAVLPALVLSGCSSSKKRDVNFGTDAGLDFQIPDAAGFSSQPKGDAGAADVVPDTGLEVEGGSLDVLVALGAADVASDTGPQFDGGGVDASVALGAADVAPDTGLGDLPADASAQESGSAIDS